MKLKTKMIIEDSKQKFEEAINKEKGSDVLWNTFRVSWNDSGGIRHFVILVRYAEKE